MRMWGVQLILVLIALSSGLVTTIPRGTPQATVRHSSVTAAQMDEMIFVWASGTSAVQRLAARDCAALRLTSAQCAHISSAVRGAWLELATRDPASVGRPNAVANTRASAKTLGALGATLDAVTHGKTGELLRRTDTTYRQITDPSRSSSLIAERSLPPGWVAVWATSYIQQSLPPGMDPQTSPYVALPDAYLKYANWGDLGNIPDIYRPYYAPNGTKTHWSVSIYNSDHTRSISNVLVTDVGPWNEDDNWWDPHGTSATLPVSCPVATDRVAADATTNPLVNGICPGGRNLRRTYYYLLYQHAGLPFFGADSYQPSGTFADGTAWPAALPRYCAQSVAASINVNGILCYKGPSAYNGYNGAWLRDNTAASPVLNQSSIDLSPAVNKALGWTYPSSGYVQVYIGGLP